MTPQAKKCKQSAPQVRPGKGVKWEGQMRLFFSISCTHRRPHFY